jgi:hypothetical protein
MEAHGLLGGFGVEVSRRVYVGNGPGRPGAWQGPNGPRSASLDQPDGSVAVGHA